MMLVAGFVGCGGGVTRPNQDTVQQPQRIICGSPAVAEIVFALGCGNRVVGVSDYTAYPPEAASIEKIGGWMNPNRERILRLQPDLIITQGVHPALATFAKEYGLGFHSVNVDDLENIRRSIIEIAEILEVPERGAEMVEEMTTALDKVRSSVAEQSTPSVLLVLGRTPGSLSRISTVGPGTFLDEMITIAGGSNIFSDVTGAYPQVSKESIMARNPEVIIDMHPDNLSTALRQKMNEDWQALETVTAVANGRISLIEENLLLVPGPRIAAAAELLAGIIHPETRHE